MGDLQGWGRKKWASLHLLWYTAPQCLLFLLEVSHVVFAITYCQDEEYRFVHFNYMDTESKSDMKYGTESDFQAMHQGIWKQDFYFFIFKKLNHQPYISTFFKINKCINIGNINAESADGH